MRQADTDKCLKVIGRRLGWIENLSENYSATVVMGHGVGDNWHGHISIMDHRLVHVSITFKTTGKSPQEVLANMASAILLDEGFGSDEIFPDPEKSASLAS